MSSDVVLRLATLADAEAIREIYNREVREATSTFDMIQRSADDQRAWLSERSGAFSAIVAVDAAGGEVLGFASLSPYKDRAAYSTTVEDSVYVHRDHAGRGIGRLLLARLVEIARESGFHTVIARIEASGERRGRCTNGAASSSWGSNVRSGASSSAGSTSRSCNACSDVGYPPFHRACDTPSNGVRSLA